MFRHTLRRSLKTLHPVPVFPKRNIAGASKLIPNYEAYGYQKPRNPDNELWNELKKLKNEISTSKNDTAIQSYNFDNTAASGISSKEAQRLEHKIDVSKTNNSWENRKLATEMNDMDIKYSERIDGLARDIQQQKAEFHTTIDTNTMDLWKQIEALNVRFDKGGVPKNPPTGRHTPLPAQKKETKNMNTENDEPATISDIFFLSLMCSILAYIVGTVAIMALRSFDCYFRPPIYKETITQQLDKLERERKLEDLTEYEENIRRRETSLLFRENMQARIENKLQEEEMRLKGNTAIFLEETSQHSAIKPKLKRNETKLPAKQAEHNQVSSGVDSKKFWSDNYWAGKD